LKQLSLRVAQRASVFLFLCVAAFACMNRDSTTVAPTEAQLLKLAVRGTSGPLDDDGDQDSPEVALGHRLFKETRFAQFFASHSSDVNQPLAQGDPVMEHTPYAGKSMNCATCHMVEEQQNVPGRGMRSYADFNRRTPIPLREDGRTQTTRNTPSMVNVDIDRDTPFFLHFDGQFTSVDELAIAGLTGRNFGWLANESDQALAQIVKVIRLDNGNDSLAKEYFGSYAQVFAGTDASIPKQFVLPSEYRMNVVQASDTQIIAAVGRMIGVYEKSLQFKKDSDGNYSDSPYDLFLKKNNLPRKPLNGENNLSYARRLRTAIVSVQDFQFVSEKDGNFKLSTQKFTFGPTELQGFQIFLAENSDDASLYRRANPRSKGGGGSCITCHAPPDFTDFKFHNTGATQIEYDGIHGVGTFAHLGIPDLKERNDNPEIYLGPSAAHPKAAGMFITPPSALRPGFTDLGLWNVVGNPGISNPQAAIKSLLCSTENSVSANCSDNVLLERALALFKTPSLRDLGQSQPYLHTGQKDTLEDVIRFYQATAALEKLGRLRNGAPELSFIDLAPEDVAPLASFLSSLNEDYH